jgi:predicted metal-dependent peptidase
MEKTRLRLMLDYPFFGSLALTLQHKSNATIGTCATDGKTLQYNPDFIDSLTPNEKLFLYLHEICHIILGHSVRRGTRDPKLWNIAGDHAVNLLLRDSVDLSRPEGGLCNTDYSGLSAEEIYTKLNEEFPEDIREEEPPPPPEEDPDGEVTDDSANSEVDGETTSYPDNEPPLPFDESSQPDPTPQPGSDLGGDNSTDETEASDTPDPERMDRIERYRDMVGAMERFGMVEDISEEEGLTESDIQSTTSLIDRMLNNSDIATPEPIRRLVRQFVSTKVPWQELLARFIHKSCEQKYNWSKPNRRFNSTTNIILPSLEHQLELSIAIVIDTSGSINDVLLNLFMSELSSLMSSVEYSKIHMISCSHEVFGPQSFDKGDQLLYQPVGEGETRFRPAFEHISRIDPAPSCVIYFTDLFSDDFGPEPEMPVLWIGDYKEDWFGSHQARVPFGELITMHEEE